MFLYINYTKMSSTNFIIELSEQVSNSSTKADRDKYSKYTTIPITSELNLSEFFQPGLFKDLYDTLFIEGWHFPIKCINHAAMSCKGCPFILYLKLLNKNEAHKYPTQGRKWISTQFYDRSKKPAKRYLTKKEKSRLLQFLKDIDGTLLVDVTQRITREYLSFRNDIKFTNDDIKDLQLPSDSAFLKNLI